MAVCKTQASCIFSQEKGMHTSLSLQITYLEQKSHTNASDYWSPISTHGTSVKWNEEENKLWEIWIRIIIIKLDTEYFIIPFRAVKLQSHPELNMSTAPLPSSTSRMSKENPIRDQIAHLNENLPASSKLYTLSRCVWFILEAITMFSSWFPEHHVDITIIPADTHLKNPVIVEWWFYKFA